MGAIAEVRAVLRCARLDRHEIAGSLGDLGTFLPLLVGMSARNGLDFGSSLFFAGIFNVATGFLFALPMAVQPMKAIAAVALVQGLSAAEIVAAGATVSAVVLVLGIFGLVDVLIRVIPRSVIRGLQLAIGLSLCIQGLQMVEGTGTWLGPDSYLTGLLCAALVLALLFSRIVPAALALFAAGIAIAVWKDPGVLGSMEIRLSLPSWSPPAWGDFASSFAGAALPQIPLTTLNSVIAVAALTLDLFPDRPASARKITVSVGLMNLCGLWFGAMPMCHGAGGLAAQYRFGARTNGSILFLGAAKAIVAILFGSSLMALCAAFPASVLGVMLVFTGIELGAVARDQTRWGDAFVTILTAGACIGLNVVLGFTMGMAVGWFFKLWPARKEER